MSEKGFLGEEINFRKLVRAEPCGKFKDRKMVNKTTEENYYKIPNQYR